MIQMSKRIFLFVVVNALVVLTISIALNLLGLRPYLSKSGVNYQQLILFCLLWGMTGSFISLATSRIVAKRTMGVRVISPKTMQPGEVWFVETVTNLARAAGLPRTPELGVYDSPEINAFATGPTKNRSLVAVSSGLLLGMDAPEVTAVLAHEISHIANGDMVTMTLLQGVVNAFVLFLSRILAFIAEQSVRGSAKFLVRTVVIIICELFLSFFGAVVVAWFSRRREYRADAGGAFLAGAGNMVNALTALQNVHTGNMSINKKSALSAFKISGNFGLFSLFATHPPLSKRISRLQTSG